MEQFFEIRDNNDNEIAKNLCEKTGKKVNYLEKQ